MIPYKIYVEKMKMEKALQFPLKDQNAKVNETVAQKKNEAWDFSKTTKTVTKRLSSLYYNKNFSDITFIVQESEVKHKFDAHKLILGLSSPVFEAMFFGMMADSNHEVTVIDISPKAFENMLNFLYLDEVEFSDLQSAIDTEYVARKYLISRLEEKCVQYLCKASNPGNVCQLYELACFLDLKNLIEACTVLIEEETEHIFMSESFMSLNESTVKKIISLANLSIPPNSIFQCVHIWAGMKCIQNNKEISQNISSLMLRVPSLWCLRYIQNDYVKVELIRSTMLPLLPYIQFLQMDSKSFVADVVSSEILMPEEIAYILSHIVNPNVNYPFKWPNAFNLHKRCK